jgi:hypothetical protein
MWQRVTEARVAHMARLPAFVPVVALGVVLIAVVAGLLFGTPDRLE